jgi:transcriptional regulator with XRE-family HTH domain
MKFDNLLSDQAALTELGLRIADARLARRMTQAQLAEAAGVSKSTVERLEDGGSTHLANLIRCLRALGRLEALERLFPETPVNPVELLGRRRRRQRVRSPKGAPSPVPWTWGDQGGEDA